MVRKDNTPITGISLQSYIEAVTKVVNQQEGKVILVGHSMGGMVISQVAENVPAQIEKRVYLSAYLPANGQDLQSLSATDSESLIGPNLVFLPDYSAVTIKREFALQVFAGDCSDAIKKLVMDNHKAEPLAPFGEKVTLSKANFGAVPKYYIETTKDQSVSTANQQRMIAANGKLIKVYKLDSGHSPYFAKPTELVSILKQK
jgi:pimeloyl-ACP methyl ester carboxylesterase